MTAKEIDLLVNLIDNNAKANEDAHKEIVRRLGDIGEDMRTSLGTLKQHCADREAEVNRAIASVSPKKYTPYQTIKGVGRVLLLILAQAGVTVGILAAVGVLGS
jgi:hypothetical protein